MLNLFTLPFKVRGILMSFALMLLVAQASIAQVTVRGVIKDDNTGETMIGAAVVIKGTTIGSVTDIDGKFEFIAPDSPPFTLVISFLGYTSQEVEVESLDQKISIGLSTDEVLMDEVQVVGERISKKQKESPLTVESMDVLAIKETASADFYEGVGQLKGVDLTTASMLFKVINTRGFNSTAPVRSLQIIDGVDNQSPGLNFSLGNFLGASEMEVMKLDIIQGASSAYFGPNAFNGVISMTTKNPFQFPGLAVGVKVGERGLFDASFRYAQVIKNKDGEEKFAYKLNVSFMQANDWEANNMDSTELSEVDSNNWGGYDAVNRYGDENLNNSTTSEDPLNAPGLGIWHRDGYLESDLVDYNSRNIKAGAAFHYRLKPDVELIYASNFSTGTTVYQGDNRYSLKDILFFQNRIEVRKKDKYFLRAYATNENAGDSYDAVFTAFLLQDAAKGNSPDNFFRWSKDYQNYWGTNITPKVWDLPGYPDPNNPLYTQDWFGDTRDSTIASANTIMVSFSDSMMAWHDEARAAANLENQFFPTTDRYEPGTARYDSAKKSIISLPLSRGGTRIIDRSALYHVHGEYKFTPEFMDIVVGANFRMYRPKTEGTVFKDTSLSAEPDLSLPLPTGNPVIKNSEYGFYAGVEKRIWKEKLKINITSRLDKNENFDAVMSPAASLVYSHSPSQILRFSFSSAIRNPTLADQYLYYNVGRAILLGNINGVDSIVTIPSLYDFFATLDDAQLDYFNVDPIKPEKVKTYEVGYRATFFKSLYLDANYYFSVYRDFIGFKLGAKIGLDCSFGPCFPTDIQAYRVAANSDDLVTTQGASIGLNYFFKKFLALSANYTWSKLDLQGSTDPIIPAYNTPEHKYNVGISGRDVRMKLGSVRLNRWGFSVNYKWIQGFRFEGSPQFTGKVPTYDLVDFQVNKYFPKLKATAKIGASNVLNKERFQVYGGPFIGRLGYFSLLFEIDKL